MPGGFVCSASFKGLSSGQEVLEVSAGTLPLRKIFSKSSAPSTTNTPRRASRWTSCILGPTFLLKAKHQPKDFDRRITVELWLYPDGERILEISTKCLPDETFGSAGRSRTSWPRGIVLGAEQAPKTKTSLEFYTAKLRREGVAG